MNPWLKLLLRVVLLGLMAWYGYEVVMAYTYDFRTGYPLTPLLLTAGCFWAYLRLRPAHVRPRPMASDIHSLDSLLCALLAVVGAAFLLHLRGREAFGPLWYLEMATLTFFFLLIPAMIAYPFRKLQTVVTAVSTLMLLALLWKGSQYPMLDFRPVPVSDLGVVSYAAPFHSPEPVFLPRASP